MKIQNNFSRLHSNFKAFRIENPVKTNISAKDSKAEKDGKDEFRGTAKFLHKETVLIQNAKKEISNIKFEEPLDKIIGIIQRQEDNPFDLVMYAEEGSCPDDDRIFLALKDPQGNIIHQREVYNSVNIIKRENREPEILSHFYTMLNIGEKLAEKYQKML